jgi:hypothetical protein
MDGAEVVRDVEELRPRVEPILNGQIFAWFPTSLWPKFPTTQAPRRQIFAWFVIHV